MSITQHKLRLGSFTSSEIWKLTRTAKDGKSFGEKALTYIEEKNIERRMGRGLRHEVFTNDMAWGTICEQRVFDLLGLEFMLTSNETKVHPEIDYWAGSADLVVVGNRVSEIKCYQPKNFALLTDALLTKDPEKIKKKFPEEYYQVLSNAIINQVSKAEIITYMPYRKELKEIREMAEYWDRDAQWKYRFIYEKEDSWLAWLPDNGFYKNLNQFEFEIPRKDIDYLTSRVLEAGKMLIEPKVLEPEKLPE